MKTSVIINTTDATGKKYQKTLSDVNPEAGNYEISQFSKMLIGMTTNVYGSTTRINREDITDAEPEVIKPTPTFELASTSMTAAAFVAAADATDIAITYNGDATPHALNLSNSGSLVMSCKQISNVWNLRLERKSTTTSAEAFVGKQVKVIVDETDNYKGASAIFTFTES